jgi:hypothetical protein
MEIRIRATGQVMLEDELRRWAKDNGGPSWDRTTDEVLEALGADVVFEGPQAQPTRYQVAFRDGVQEMGGKWYTKYSVADMDDEAKAAKDAEQAKSVREQRNQKLKDTDWTVIKALESNTPQNFDMAAYRQALRDITSQAGFPWDVQWPTQPE